MNAHRDLTPGFERDIITRRPTFFTSETFLRRDGKLVKIDKPDDAQASFHREWLLLRLRTDWKPGGRAKTYPAGACWRSTWRHSSREIAAFDVLFEPTERKSLASASPTRHFIILNELDNVRSRIEVLSHRDGRWIREPMPGLPDLVDASAHAVDPEDSDDYFLTTAGFLTPTTLAMGTAGGGPAETLKRLPAFFDAKGLAVTQHEAVSEGRHPHPLFPGRPRRPGPRRQQSDAAHRLRRVPAREEAGVRSHDRGRLAGEGGGVTSSPISAAAASSARSGTAPR